MLAQRCKAVHWGAQLLQAARCHWMPLIFPQSAVVTSRRRPRDDSAHKSTLRIGACRFKNGRGLLTRPAAVWSFELFENQPSRIIPPGISCVPERTQYFYYTYIKFSLPTAFKRIRVMPTNEFFCSQHSQLMLPCYPRNERRPGAAHLNLPAMVG